MPSKRKTTATKEEAKPALVPKLRFPEFRGSEEWQPYVLEELEDMGWVELGRGEVISGQDIKAIPGHYPIYSSSVKNNGLMGTYGRFMFDEELISWSVDGGGDFFHRPRHKFSVTNVSGFMRINTSHLNYRFLASHLQALHGSLTFDYQFKAHPSVIRKLYRLAIPSLAEQQKIAECLSSVDEVIAAQARKVDALKTHKKGLMQQLFPREGETQPRLRFPKFQNAGDWEEQPLKKVFSIFQGFAFSSGDSVEQGCRWLKIADVGIQVMNHDAPSFLPEAFKEHFSKFAVREGDYVVALTRPILSGQLKIAKVDDVFDGALLNQRVGKLLTSQDPAFVFFLLQTQKLIGDIERSISGNDPPNLSAQQIEGLKTFVPSPPEQHRIATCLSSLDALIAAEVQKLEALKTHKRGLMQQLFPSPEDS